MRAGGADEVADPPYAGPCRLGAEVGAGADDGAPGGKGAAVAGLGSRRGDLKTAPNTTWVHGGAERWDGGGLGRHGCMERCDG